MFDYFHKRPYLLYSLIAGFFTLGIYGLIVMPKNLFPVCDRPTVIVISQVPGATPDVVTATVSKPVEQELSSLAQIRQVSSTNIAGLSIVTAEFEYKKGLDAAAVDVNNAVGKVRGMLPSGVNPSISTAGSFTLPVDVFALSPVDGDLSLDDIKKIAKSDIKPALLRNMAIGNVEIFGGYQSAITIDVDPFAAGSHGIDLGRIAATIRDVNRDLPLGFSKGTDTFYTVTSYGERVGIEDLKRLPMAPNVTLGDIAEVNWEHQRRFSGYLGNGRAAIAVVVQRAPGGSVLSSSKAGRAEIAPAYRSQRAISTLTEDTQKALHQVDLQGMRVSQEGDIQQMGDSFRRMIKAIGIGVILLLVSLIAIYLVGAACPGHDSGSAAVDVRLQCGKKDQACIGGRVLCVAKSAYEKRIYGTG